MNQLQSNVVPFPKEELVLINVVKKLTPEQIKLVCTVVNIYAPTDFKVGPDNIHLCSEDQITHALTTLAKRQQKYGDVLEPTWLQIYQSLPKALLKTQLST